MKTRGKHQELPSESIENVGNSSEDANASKKAMVSTERLSNFRKRLYMTTKAHESVKAKDQKHQQVQYAEAWLKRENYETLKLIEIRNKKKREKTNKIYLSRIWQKKPQ